jgi:hypothetical protein
LEELPGKLTIYSFDPRFRSLSAPNFNQEEAQSTTASHFDVMRININIISLYNQGTILEAFKRFYEFRFGVLGEDEFSNK